MFANSINTVYKVLAILLGYGLIIGGFVVFGQSLEDRIRILDIIVSVLIFTQFVLFLFFPLIDRKDPSHKEAGMMGVHFVGMAVCIPLSIILMVVGIIMELSFSIQLIGQLLILFVLLIMRIATIGTGKKVQAVYNKEQQVVGMRDQLKWETENFMDYVHSVKGLDVQIVEKLQAIQESTRYITPSSKPEALSFDAKIIQSLDDLKVLMRDLALNKDKIEEEVSSIERTLSRRKKY